MHVAAGVLVVAVMVGLVCGTPARSGIFGSVVVPSDVDDVERFYKHTKIILNGGHHVVCQSSHGHVVVMVVVMFGVLMEYVVGLWYCVLLLRLLLYHLTQGFVRRDGYFEVNDLPMSTYMLEVGTGDYYDWVVTLLIHSLRL